MDQMSKTRAERAKALEEWAERPESSDLKEADTEAFAMIPALTPPSRLPAGRCARNSSRIEPCQTSTVVATGPLI